MNNIEHKPVLLNEVIEFLKVKEEGIYLDATVGEGGHSRAILKKLKRGLLIAIDCDEEAIKVSQDKLREFGDKVIFIKENFKNIDKILKKIKIKKLDGILFDLGASLLQLQDEKRGFSFLKEGPLDMRMDRGGKLTAFDVINKYPVQRIQEIIRNYGEERFSKRISKFIEKEREKGEISNTIQLANIVKSAIPKKFWSGRIHPATRTFQAIRIEVNKELEILEESLKEGINFLKKGCRIVVISFHSLEDRIAKRTFLEFSNKTPPILKILTKKPVIPTKEEIEKNRRARSAKLRAGEKI